MNGFKNFKILHPVSTKPWENGIHIHKHDMTQMAVERMHCHALHSSFLISVRIFVQSRALVKFTIVIDMEHLTNEHEISVHIWHCFSQLVFLMPWKGMNLSMST